MPLWLLISLMQLFIPLNLMLRSCCIEEVEHFWIHWFSGIIILTGGVLNMLTLKIHQEDTEGDSYQYFSIMVIVSVLLDVVSHTIKEIIVRTQPLNQEKFNFRVSIT